MRETKVQHQEGARELSKLARVATSALFVAGVAGLASTAGAGCGRSSLEDAILDGGPTTDARTDAPVADGGRDSGDGGDAGACGPSTCPTGCCDDRGVCRVGSDVQACGTLGGKCTDCVATGFDTCEASRKACGKKVPTCDATSCASGCCVSSGTGAVCLPGNAASACGTGGDKCSDCGATGRACDEKTRACSTATTCDATTCPTGCCVGDKCQPGTVGTACGTKGQICENCTSAGTTCGPVPGGGGLCEGIGRCGPMNCGGCCDARGNCTEGIDNTSCGRGGEACRDCTPRAQVCAPRDQPDGRTCVTPPPPTCGPANCAGCCDGDTCVRGTDAATCGVRGQACRDCGAGTCQPGGLCSNPACSAATCPGCCQGDRCLAGFTNRACGSGGAACGDCSVTNTTCNTAAVPRACGVPSTCPATYGACPAGVAQAVLPQRTNTCSAAALSNAQAACTGGVGSAACVSYYAFLAATEPACATCMESFRSDFFDPNFPTLGKGLAACVSPFVNAACLRNLGCATDCVDTSCTQCPVGGGDACRSGVTQPRGQCSDEAVQAAQCAGPALLGGPAAVCNPATYGLNYGRWLEAVGTRFCGR